MDHRPFRLAALDIGSLTVRLGIAEIRHPAHFPQMLHLQESITRLGSGLSGDGWLSARAQEDTLRVLDEYASLCRTWQVHRVRPVATQVLRLAVNQEDFLQRVSEQTGLQVEVLSPESETQLSLEGVLASLDSACAARRPLVIFDLGGGSLEWSFLLAATPPAFASLPLGALTLLQSWQTSDPPRPDEQAILAAAIRQQLQPLRLHLEKVRPLPAGHLVGSGGAITTLAALLAGLFPYQPEIINNLRLGRDAIEGMLRRLCALPLASRSHLPGLLSAKADVIIPGAAIILAILEFFSVPEVIVMDAGLLEGVLALLPRRVLVGRS
jgi:exopolyphosphatase / guanosine-5'-triphosphate,3'-diphosphate pyrophosphatase